MSLFQECCLVTWAARLKRKPRCTVHHQPPLHWLRYGNLRHCMARLLAAGFPDSAGDLWMLWPPNIIYLLNISPFHLFEWLGPRRQSRYDMDGCRGAGGWPGGGYTEPWLPWWVVEVINDKWYQIIIILPAGDLFPPLRYFSSHNYSWLRLGRGGARRRYGSLIESEIFIFYFPKWVGI